jgi:hypothetical protein
MTYGLRVFNDDSELLVDSELVNPTFVQKLEFGTTPTYIEAGPYYAQAHPGYIRRDYSTSTFTIATGGSYIVMWVLPDTIIPGEPTKDIWYNFPSSSIVMSKALTCSVYANSEGTPITYSLPTAYIFAVNAAALNALTSSGPALRMYNSSQVKTFDSSFVQLVPYSITDNFDIPGSETTTSLYLPVPTNPIYLVPKSAVMFAGDNGFGYSSEKVFDTSYRRRGQYIDSRTISTSYVDGQPEIGSIFASFIAGNVGGLSVIAADADFYQAPSGGGGGGSNPTYSLSSDYVTVNEGTIITITLTTTLINDNTSVPWTITGISSADLVSGGLTGNFVVQSNTATATFIIKNDALTEGTEIFKLSLNGLSTEVNVTINDTSLSPGYYWATPSSVNENSTSSLIFNYSNAPSKTINFSIVYGTNVSGSDITLNTTTHTTPSNNNAGTVSVSYSTAADLLTEGSETFILRANVDGTNYDSSAITINDTSTAPTPIYTITVVGTNWPENSTQSTTINIQNALGSTFTFVSNNANVTCDTSSLYINSNNYTTGLFWTVGAVAADTTVNLAIKVPGTGTTGGYDGALVATTSVVVKNVLPAGTPIGNPYCEAYGVAPYTLLQDYADGMGGITTEGTYNSPTCGYVAPSYLLSASPTTVDEGSSFVITLTTNQSGSFSYTITGVTSVDINNTSLTGTLSNGGTRTITMKNDSFTEGTEYFVVSLDNGQTAVTVTINDTSTNVTSISTYGSNSGVVGTALSTSYFHDTGGTAQPSLWSYSGTLPPGTTLTKSNNPYGEYYTTYTISGTPTTAGTYSFTVYATNSFGDSAQLAIPFVISAPSYPAAGTVNGSPYCSGTTRYQNYNDGSGGVYAEVVEYNSTLCGYVAPTYALYNTWSSLANGAGPSFYVRSNNADGITLTPSKSGAGSARVSISPTSSVISGNGQVDTYFTVTATVPTSTVPAQSVTISVAGLSFTFDVQAYSVSTQPLVTSVTYDTVPVEPGDVKLATISFDGPITAGLYVRIQVAAGVYGTGNNVFVAGDPELPIGANQGNYTSPANPGDFQTNMRISARAENSNGTIRQDYVNGPFVTLLPSGTGNQIN